MSMAPFMDGLKDAATDLVIGLHTAHVSRPLYTRNRDGQDVASGYEEAYAALACYVRSKTVSGGMNAKPGEYLFTGEYDMRWTPDPAIIIQTDYRIDSVVDTLSGVRVFEGIEAFRVTKIFSNAVTRLANLETVGANQHV